MEVFMKNKTMSANELMVEIEKLLEKIYYEDISEIAKADEEINYQIENSKKWGHYWGGADVMIYNKLLKNHKEWLGNQPIVFSLQMTEPRRRVVITKFAAELSWLFIQLRGLYRGRIDYISKYDFYGELAQKAIDTINFTNDELSYEELLLAVLRQSKVYI